MTPLWPPACGSGHCSLCSSQRCTLPAPLQLEGQFARFVCNSMCTLRSNTVVWGAALQELNRASQHSCAAKARLQQQTSLFQPSALPLASVRADLEYHIQSHAPQRKKGSNILEQVRQGAWLLRMDGEWCLFTCNRKLRRDRNCCLQLFCS